MKSKKIIQLIALILSILMIAAFLPACSKTENTSSSQEGLDINYGEDVDIDDDEEDYNPTEIVTGTGGSGGNNSTGAVTYETNSKVEQTHEIDENKKKDFLESIPKSLSGKTVKILTWWKPGVAETKKMEYFTEKTGIKIKWVQTDLNVYYQKLSGLKAQKNSPDLACILADAFPSAIMKDYFQPLEVGKLDISKTNVFDIDSMNKFKWNGKHYGALVKGSTMMSFGFMVYNDDMFKNNGVTSPYESWQAGNWNWDTLIEISKKIKEKTGKAALTAEWQGFRLQQTCGIDAVGVDDGKLVNNLSSKAYRDAWKWVNNLDLNGTEKIADFGLNRAGFFEQKCAMAVEENWAMQKGERYDNLKFSWGYVPLPCPKNSKQVIPSDAKLWGFPVGSKNVEAASYVLEYWQNPIYDVKGYETWTNDSVAMFNDWLWEQNKTFKVAEGIVNYGGDYDYYTNFVGEIALNGAANVDTNIDKWSKVIDANIKKIYNEFG